MRSFRLLAVSCCVAGFITLASAGQEPEVRGTIEKAIEAHGGKDNISKYKAATVKFKGKLEILNMSLDVTGEQSAMAPDKFRVAMAFTIMDKNIESIQVFDGQKFWVSVLGKTTELKDEKLIKEMRESMAVERAGGIVGLLGKEYQLALIGEVKVKGKNAIGIRASKKDQRDLNLYFDKKSHLLLKTEFRTRLPMGGDQEITQEKYFFDHKEVSGIKSPRRVVIEHDGKQILDMEITETNVYETLDPGIFGKP